MGPNKAFTLVEILIVVLILGIVAAVALPKFSNATTQARVSMLADDLRILRTQIAVFKGQHRGVAPGYPACNPGNAPSEDAFIDHLTRSSNVDGETAAPGTDGYRFGPYLREIPENPLNGKTSVQIVSDDQDMPAEGAMPEAADDSHGWIYKPSALSFRADSTGVDTDGKSYYDY